MTGSQKPKHVGTTGGAWHSFLFHAGCLSPRDSVNSKDQGICFSGREAHCLADGWAQCNCEGSGAGGKGTVATSRDRTSKRAKVLWAGEPRSPVGAEEGAGRQLPQRVIIYWHRHVPCPVLGSVTSSYSVLTGEETKLKVNALEKPLSWDSNPDLSGADTHGLPSIQAAL